jgi:hypothetical protein
MSIDKSYLQKFKSILIILFFRTKKSVGLKLSIIPTISALGLTIFYANQFVESKNLLILVRALSSVTLTLLILVYLVAYLIVISIRKSGINKSYLKLLKNGDISLLSLLKIAPTSSKGIYYLDKPHKGNDYYEFAETENLGSISGKLNYEAFKNSPWQDSEIDKINRNAKHACKNKRCILLLKDKEQNYIGFTHIIPVNQNIWNEYLNGHISDNDFSSENIVPTQKTYKDDYAHGIIVFSIALLSDNKIQDFPNRLEFLFKAIHFHLFEIAEQEFSNNRYMNVLIQTGERKLSRLCKSSYLKKHNILSKDKCEMYLGKIKLK